MQKRKQTLLVLAFQSLLVLMVYWNLTIHLIPALHILYVFDSLYVHVLSEGHQFQHLFQDDDLKVIIKKHISYHNDHLLCKKNIYILPDLDRVNCLCTYSSKSSSSFLLIILFNTTKKMPSPMANKLVNTNSFQQPSLANVKLFI